MNYSRRINAHWDGQFIKNSLNLRPDEITQFNEITFDEHVKDIVIVNAHNLKVNLPENTSKVELAGSRVKNIKLNDNQGSVILDMHTNIENVAETRYFKNTNVTYSDTSKRHPMIWCPNCKQSMLHTMSDEAFIMEPFRQAGGEDPRRNMELKRFDTVHICARKLCSSTKEAYAHQKAQIFTLK